MAFSRAAKTGQLTQEIYMQSVKELRVIYSDMSPDKFAAWYSKRWGGSKKTVLRIIGAAV